MQDKFDSLHDFLSSWWGGAGATLFGALVGRAMWHSNEARKGHRKFLSVDLIWEFPVALGMALIGEGAASYLHLGQPASTGLIAALSYLGPRGLEVWLRRWLAKQME